MNFVKGRIIKKKRNFFFKEEHFEVKIIDSMIPKLGKYKDVEVEMGIRPEDIYDKLFVGDVSPENTVRATVEVIEPMGAEVYLLSLIHI